ncbi:hypothetical protein C4N22_10825 [Faecalibacterium prausnitzii]|uniref:Uncharacterized protein n=1 Tax=Faecalibacterium prausnitzii TaxID=853 RepID=A0A329U6Z9_9FIRM|nr:hypothetical protein C4N22_10825 [Faecalibacterium prausnitzii]
MKTGESGAEIRGPPRAGQKGRNAAVAWDGSLRYRAGECWLSVEGLLPFPIWEMSRASKVAPQNRILPILSLWITHRDGVVFFYPVPQVERVFIYHLGRPLQGKEYRYENHE